MSSRAFDYMQVPLAIVATDLTGIDIPDEGAYFRVARLLAVNGPMTIRQVRDVIGTNERIERKLNWHSEDLEPLFSIKWVEEWRERANASRERLSAAGRVSAEKRAKGKRKSIRRSTEVEQQSNGSSTIVEHATILYSTILSKESSEKERARDEVFEALWITFERYGSKGKALDYWKKLPEEDRAAIVAKAPAYVASTPGCEYRKQLDGWINPAERRWERPIVVRGQAQQPPTATPRATGWDVKDPTKLSA